MGERLINFYEFAGREPEWQKVRKLFRGNISKVNVPFFEAGTALEREFLRFCESSNFTVHKQCIVEYDGDGIEAGKFIFLCVKKEDSAGVVENENFLDLSNACPGGGAFGDCAAGVIQRDIVPVSAKGVERIATLGILSPRFPNGAVIYLMSAAVAEALKSADVSGCEIVETSTPSCFQLRITSQPDAPVRIGRTRMGKRCPVCGVAKMFLSDSERYFLAGDLKATDFQICRAYYGDNVGRFEIANGFPMVSQRIFNLLLTLGVTGLNRYSTDPPVRHAIVQVRDS